MKQGDIEIGVQHIVEFPHDEAMMNFGASRGFVRATPLALAEEKVPTYGIGKPRTLKGVRCRLDERFRVVARHHDGGFVEFPVGHEFFAESRLVQWPKGKPPASWRQARHDADGVSDRESRYVEQDFVLVALAALGCDRDAFDLRGEQVVFRRWQLARLLKRTDPVEIAKEAIAFAFDWASDIDELEEATAAALEEVRQGLAVSDCEIEVPVGTEDFLAGVDVAKADANRPAI